MYDLFMPELQYITKFKRIRTIRITVGHAGEIVVNAPLYATSEIVDRFVKSKENWIKKKLDYFKRHPIRPERLFLKTLPKNDYKLKKEQAKKFVLEKVKHFAKLYDFEFNKIYIRNQKSRWGSCSRDKNLSFNYKLIYLPEEVVDYIIIHELCHTKELNHSKNFWNLVKDCLPNYKEINKNLKNIY